MDHFCWNTLVCSPSADSELATTAAKLGCKQLKQTLQTSGSSHMKREGDEEIGEIGGRGEISSLPRKGGGGNIPSRGLEIKPRLRKSAKAHCSVLCVGAGKVGQWVPERREKAQDEDCQKPRKSEIGSPVLHLDWNWTRYERFEADLNGVCGEWYVLKLTYKLTSWLTSLSRVLKFTCWLSCNTFDHIWFHYKTLFKTLFYNFG